MKSIVKRSLLLAALPLSLACGADASIDEEAADESFEEDPELELGQAEQTFSAPASPTYQLGVTTSSSRFQCTRTSSAQVCSVPVVDSNKIVRWRFDQNSGFTNTQRDLFRIFVTGLDNSLSTWTFSESEPAVVVINKAACSGNSSSNNIDAFSCLDLASTGANLTEGSGVAGQYTSHTSGVLHIDFDDINAKFSSEGDRTSLAMHAYGHALISWLGLGSRTDQGALGFVSRRGVNLNVLNLPLTPGEDCRLEAYNPSNNGQFNLSTPACSSD